MTHNTRITTLFAVLVIGAMVSGCLEEDLIAPTSEVEIPTPTMTSKDVPKLPGTIDLLMADIIQNNIANKAEYSIHTQHGSDVYVCTHMACIQSEYLIENGYTAGVVMLWAKNLGMESHAQSWVEIDNETYIIESTSDVYWKDWAHKTVFSEDYKICFVSIAKGWEHAKVSSEILHR